MIRKLNDFLIEIYLQLRQSIILIDILFIMAPHVILGYPNRNSSTFIHKCAIGDCKPLNTVATAKVGCDFCINKYLKEIEEEESPEPEPHPEPGSLILFKNDN